MKSGRYLFLALCLVLLNGSLVLSQELEGTTAAPAVQNEPELQWVWGEAVSIDAQNKLVVLKYLDYETDQEKEININVDDKTIYDNIQSIDQIKSGDELSVDYIATPEGQNIAKNISLEKPEATPAPEPNTAETTTAPTP